jgi:predicted NACHT family NTPase
VLEVLPFNTSQVRRFVESWYLANEIRSSGNVYDAGVRHRANQDAKDLLQRLRHHPSIGAMTVNPLLLTMIAMVHRYHGALPGTRVELYAEICEVLLGRWR